MTYQKRKRTKHSGDNFNLLATAATNSFGDNFNDYGGGGPGIVPGNSGADPGVAPPMSGGGGAAPSVPSTPSAPITDNFAPDTPYYGFSVSEIDNANCASLYDMIEEMIYFSQNAKVPAAYWSQLEDMRTRLQYAQSLYTVKCNPSAVEPPHIIPAFTPISQVPASDIPVNIPANDDPFFSGGDPGGVQPPQQSQPVEPISFLEPHVDPTEVAIPPQFGGATPGQVNPQVVTQDPTTDDPEIKTAILDSSMPPSTVPYFMAPPPAGGNPGGAPAVTDNSKYKSWLAIAIAATAVTGFFLYGTKNLAGGPL